MAGTAHCGYLKRVNTNMKKGSLQAALFCFYLQITIMLRLV